MVILNQIIASTNTAEYKYRELSFKTLAAQIEAPKQTTKKNKDVNISIFCDFCSILWNLLISFEIGSYSLVL